MILLIIVYHLLLQIDASKTSMNYYKYIMYFFISGMDWSFGLALQYKNHYQAYRNISFEREAFTNKKDLDYLKKRSF